MMSAFTATKRGIDARRVLRVAFLAIAALLCWGANARAADLAIEPGSFKVETSSDKAGAHADLTNSFKFVTNGENEAGADLRNLVVELPRGFVGAPVALPTCDPAQLIGPSFESLCSDRLAGWHDHDQSHPCSRICGHGPGAGVQHDSHQSPDGGLRVRRERYRHRVCPGVGAPSRLWGHGNHEQHHWQCRNHRRFVDDLGRPGRSES